MRIGKFAIFSAAAGMLVLAASAAPTPAPASDKAAERAAAEAEKAAAREAEKAARAAEQAAKDAKAAELAARKQYLKNRLSRLDMKLASQVVASDELRSSVIVEAGDELWGQLAAKLNTRDYLGFLSLLDDEAITNDFSDLDYPDRELVDGVLERLMNRGFTLAVRLKKDVPENPPSLFAFDPEAGLAAAGRRLPGDGAPGWVVTRRLSDRQPLVLVDKYALRIFRGEWQRTRAKVEEGAAKLRNKSQWARTQLERELEDFANYVKLAAKAPPKPSADNDNARVSRRKKKKDESEKKSKYKPLTDTDIHTMGGPTNARRR